MPRDAGILAFSTLALFLPIDSSFTAGAVRDLDTIATWPLEKLAGTALALVLGIEPANAVHGAPLAASTATGPAKACSRSRFPIVRLSFWPPGMLEPASSPPAAISARARRLPLWQPSRDRQKNSQGNQSLRPSDQWIFEAGGIAAVRFGAPAPAILRACPGVAPTLAAGARTLPFASARIQP
jgi:hypothetical protein